MLCFVVLSCALSKRNNPRDDGNQFFGLAIGFVIVAGGHAAGGISGACYNPAVAFGLDVSSHWPFIYTGFELTGAVLAAILFRMVRPEDFNSSTPVLVVRKCISA